MKSEKVQLDKDNNPINDLYLAANKLVEMMRSSIKSSGGNPNSQICMPVWIDTDKKMLITIEQGPKTESDYAIFKAQTK